MMGQSYTGISEGLGLPGGWWRPLRWICSEDRGARDLRECNSFDLSGLCTS